MINLFKKSITVELFTEEDIPQSLYPKLSKDSIPFWWKNLPSFYADHEFNQIQWATVKKCIGIIEIFKNGIMIPLDKDITISNNNPFTIKLPWKIKDKNFLDFVIIQATWNMEEYNRNITIVPKFFKQVKDSIQIDILPCLYRIDEELLIPKGTVLFHMIPLTEKSIDLKINTLKQENFYG